MITVGMNYRVRAGKQKVFEQKFEAVLETINAAAGHVDSKLYNDVHDDCAYLIVSEWSDQSQFVAFIRSEAFKAVTAWGKEQILTERPQHTVYQSQSREF